MAQFTRHEELRTRTERPVTAREPAPPIEYATRAPKRSRWLRPGVAVALIICGTFLAITPWWAASIALGREQPVSIFASYYTADFKWICVVLGAIMILAGTFGAAPHSTDES